jgi:hypothetical protein
MELNEIWEFDNGSAYDLCRIVSVNPPAAIHAQTNSPIKSAYLINPAAPGWRKIGKAAQSLSFKFVMPKTK